jgi:hypothetical protein
MNARLLLTAIFGGISRWQITATVLVGNHYGVACGY